MIRSFASRALPDGEGREAFPVSFAAPGSARSRSRGLLLLLAALLAPAPAPAEPPAEEPALAEWSVERFTREEKLLPGTAVRIENLHGDLRLRTGPEDLLVAWAVAQRHEQDPRVPALAIEAREGELVLRVVLPEGEGSAPATWARRRLDLVVEVPAGTAVKARTDRGLVEVRGITGPVEARSRAGDLRFRAKGPVDLETERGEILVLLDAPRWAFPVRLRTVTGAIELHLRADADAALRLATRGSFTTDFSLEVRRVPGHGKEAAARLGEGRAPIELASEQGPVRLLEMPVAVPANPTPPVPDPTPPTP